MTECVQAYHSACGMHACEAAFSNANDANKTVIVKDGMIEVDGSIFAVKWIGNFTEGNKTVGSIEDGLGSKVRLDDQTVFENPAKKQRLIESDSFPSR